MWCICGYDDVQSEPMFIEWCESEAECRRFVPYLISLGYRWEIESWEEDDYETPLRLEI